MELKTWERVQKLLVGGSARDRDQPNTGEHSPLAGIIFDHQGERLTPSHAVKGGRRYRYYISQSLVTDKAKPGGIRLSAPEVEGAVAAAVRSLLNDPAQVEKLLGSHAPTPSGLKQLIANSQELVISLNRKPASDQLVVLRPVFSSVIIGSADLGIVIKPQQLALLLVKPDAALPDHRCLEDVRPAHRITLPMRLGRRGNETRLIIQSGTQQRPVDHKLLNLIARGFAWREDLFSGTAQSASDIGDRDGISRPYVSRLINLSFLAPDIIAAIANGTAPADLSSERLQSFDVLPLDWASQRAVLGFGR